MSRMNARDRRKYYRLLVQRDGDRCFICNIPGYKKKLVIDHWDNDNSNNELLNLHLICQSDNIKKNPRRKGKKMSPVCVSELEEERINSAEMRKNREAEPKFRHWIYEKLKMESQIEFDETVNSGAEVVWMSQEAIKRYLKKLCSVAGILQVMKDESGKKFIRRKDQKNIYNRNAIPFDKEEDVNTKLVLLPSKTEKVSDLRQVQKIVGGNN